MTTSATARCLNYYGVANTFTGHGRVSIELVAHMLLRGLGVNWFPLCSAERDNNQIPVRLKRLFRDQVRGPGLMWACYDHTVNPEWKGSLRYVVHETDRLPPEAIKMYRETACAIAVPSRWNEQTLRKSGWRGRIYVVPHGVSTAFKFAPCKSDQFIFGCSARYGSTAARRKNIEQLIETFQRAFPHTHDGSIRLHIKSFPDDYEIRTNGDHRITVIREFWDQDRYTEWLRQISVYVNMSSGEGWCMPLHEAMAVGRPAITPRHGGLTEYVNDKCCYFIPYRIKKVDGGFYSGQNLIFPAMDYAIEAMRYCAQNQQDVIARGLAATTTAHQFSWNSAGTKMYNVLVKEGLLQ